MLVLTLPYSKHLGATYGAYALGGWFAIFHGYSLGVFHFPLGAALHTVCFHKFHLLSAWRIDHFVWNVNNLERYTLKIYRRVTHGWIKHALASGENNF